MLVKKSVPADRLLVIQLEGGLGWDEICPFLGVSVPEESWPARNTPKEFKATVGEFMMPAFKRAILKSGIFVLSSAVAVAAAVIYTLK